MEHFSNEMLILFAFLGCKLKSISLKNLIKLSITLLYYAFNYTIVNALVNVSLLNYKNCLLTPD